MAANGRRDISPLQRAMQITSQQISQFHTEVLEWYHHNGRDLPWRHTTDPYSILVSEMMLQQTQVPRVVEKYKEWLVRFPTVYDLAAAVPSAVILAWVGLGYNRRALYLQRAAQAITQLSEFPTSVTDLVALPGIGPYTAAAICSFAYNQNVALVDTNIKRIYQLLLFGDQNEPPAKLVLAAAEQFLPLGRSRAWHNALMDIGTILSKERTALAQQNTLINLFPSLATYELPLVKDQPLMRSKQTAFKGSRRYWRGQIVNVLRTHPQLTIKEIKKILNFPKKTTDITYSFEEVVTSLVNDALIDQEGDTIRLPNK